MITDDWWLSRLITFDTSAVIEANALITWRKPFNSTSNHFLSLSLYIPI